MTAELQLRPRSTNDRHGFLLVSVLVCLALVMVLFASALRTVGLERQQVRANEFRQQAEYLAGAGLARAVAQLAESADYSGETWQIDPDHLTGRGAATVVIRVAMAADQPQVRTVEVVADYPIENPQRAASKNAHNDIEETRRGIMNKSPVRAFTLVELLVVMAIIGVLVSMLMPAIQASREVGRRHLCRANLAQMMLAVQNYENAFESFPAGVLNPDGPIRSEAKGVHFSWIVQMLPQLDEANAYRLIDFSAGAYDSQNAPVRALSPGLFICPSEPYDRPGATNYAGCHHDVESPIDVDNHGVMFLNSHVRREEVSDGLSHTIILGEKRMDSNDLGWMSGTRATLRNTGLAINDSRYLDAGQPPPTGNLQDPTIVPTLVGGFASAHVSGAMIGFADGSVRFVSDSIDLQLWQQLGHRADGKLLDVDLREY